MKRFNFTGRKKILKDDVKVKLRDDFGHSPVVDVRLDLSEYEFPGQAKVILEAEHKTRFMRIDLGSVTPVVMSNGIVLDRFDDAENLQFRIKVVDVENGGLLFGIANKIKPYDKDDNLDTNSKSILPVESKDLTSYGVLWRIDWGTDSVVLQVDRELGSKDQVVRSLTFKSFIFPAAVHLILRKIVNDRWDSDLSDTDELQTQWILFAQQLGAGLPDPSEDADNDDWIESTIRLFMQKLNVRNKLLEDVMERGLK